MNGLEQYVFWNDFICCNIRIGIFVPMILQLFHLTAFPMAGVLSGMGSLGSESQTVHASLWTVKVRTENLGAKIFGQRLVRYGWYFCCSISLVVSFPYLKNSLPLLDPSKIHPQIPWCFLVPHQGLPRSIPAVRGMYDRYPLGWPGGSPAPNLVAWID